MYRQTDALTDRWIERQANGQTERRTGWQAGRQKSVWEVGLIGSLNKWRDRKASRWAVGQVDRWAGGQVGKWAVGQVGRCSGGQLGRRGFRKEE
jgi:hypothetical protein